MTRAVLAFVAVLNAACMTYRPVPPAATRAIRGATHVTFPSRDGDLTHSSPTTIDGWLFRPPGAGPFPAVVALHGCAGLYARGGELTARHRDWAERLVGEGYAVLLPDSFSARGVDEICSRDERTIRTAYERNRDAWGALTYLRSQPFVRADRVALLGWSNGAMTVLAAVAAQTRARPADAAPPRVAVAFYPGCASTLARADWSPMAPLHVLIGALDDWTAPQPCEALVARTQAAGGSADIVVYPGAFHDFDDPGMAVHTRGNVASTASGRATLGTNPAARADAIARVTRILRDALAGP